MGIKAVIFDFGGVLVRTLDSSGREKWEKRLGLTKGDLSKAVFDSRAALDASIGLGSHEVIWDHLAERFNLEPEQLIQLQEDFWGGDVLDLELIHYLRSLRPDYATAILSNAWDNARRLFTERFLLADVVDLILISAEEGVAKPDPQIYRLAAERLGVKPEEAVFVDDFFENILGARDVGMHTVHYQNTPQTLGELNQILSIS